MKLFGFVHDDSDTIPIVLKCSIDNDTNQIYKHTFTVSITIKQSHVQQTEYYTIPVSIRSQTEILLFILDMFNTSSMTSNAHIVQVNTIL